MIKYGILDRVLRFSVLAIVVVAGCRSHDESRRSQLAANTAWRVAAVGDLGASGRGFQSNLVTFEAERFGSIYARGTLYEAGPHDRPFNVKYEQVGWVSPNVLRLAAQRSGHSTVTRLVVHNKSNVPVRWLTVSTDELFLVLNLPVGESIEFSAKRWGDPSVAVTGEFEDGQQIRKSARALSTEAATAEIVNREDDWSLSAQLLSSRSRRGVGK